MAGERMRKAARIPAAIAVVVVFMAISPLYAVIVVVDFTEDTTPVEDRT